jgi:signal transduction histidine kinase/CheY-like chemotaxis protein
MVVGGISLALTVFYGATAYGDEVISGALGIVVSFGSIWLIYQYRTKASVVYYCSQALVTLVTVLLWQQLIPLGLYILTEECTRFPLGTTLGLIPLPLAAFIFRSSRPVLLHGTAFIVLMWTTALTYSGPRPSDGVIGDCVYLTVVCGCLMACLAFFGSVAESMEELTLEMKGDLRSAVREADMERQANAAKTRFVSVMSHEIRNPLQAIILQTEMLERESLTVNQMDLVKGISRASQIVLSITNDVLDVTKIESGAVSLECIPFNLRETIEFVVQTNAPRAAQKGVELVFLGDPVMPVHVKGDPLRLRQVLHNLIANALKFTETGEVEVRLVLQDESVAYADATTKVRRRWHVAVRDTGIGIAEADVPKLFREFSQVDESTTREYGGTGLGLFICRQLTELMAGEVWVESTQGTGSTFHFTVLLEHDEAFDEAALQAAQAVRLETSPVHWHLILAAGNDALLDNLEEHVRYFFGGPARLDVDRTTDASHLAHLLRDTSAAMGNGEAEAEEKRHLVPLVDYDMLTVDVRSALAECVAVAASSTPPVAYSPVVVTVDPTAALRKELSAAGFHRYVCKPLTLGQTTTCLASLVEEQERSELRGQRSSAKGHAVSGTKGSTLRGAKQLPFASVDAAGVGATPEEADESVPGSDRPYVLIVDDFALVRDLVQRVVVDGFGYRTLVAGNGAEALEIVKTRYGEVGAILMDCEMPVMDGFQATIEIRAYEEERGDVAPSQRVPICAMTANAMREDVQRCLSIGMDDFLSKPVRRQDLQEKLDLRFRAHASFDPTATGKESAKRRSGKKRHHHHKDLSKQADPGDARTALDEPPPVPHAINNA